jgi:lipid-binding SYLF domain-containing protein
VFAGVSLDGATLSNAELYHTKRTNKEIVMGKTKAPAVAQLRAELDRYSLRKEARK